MLQRAPRAQVRKEAVVQKKHAKEDGGRGEDLHAAEGECRVAVALERRGRRRERRRRERGERRRPLRRRRPRDDRIE